MEENMQKYLQKSHEFAIEQAIDKIVFETHMSDEYFDSEPIDINNINEYLSGSEIFSEEELKKILQEAQKILKNDKSTSK